MKVPTLCAVTFCIAHINAFGAGAITFVDGAQLGNRGSYYTMEGTTAILLNGARVGCPDSLMAVHSSDPTKARVVFCPRPKDAPVNRGAL